MKIRVLLLVFIVFTVKLYSATSVDSLYQVLKKASSPAEKSRIYKQIAEYCADEQQQDEAKKNITLMVSFAEKDGAALLFEQLAYATRMLVSIGDFNYAGQLNNRYLRKFESKKDQGGIAVCYHNLGRIQLFTGNTSEAGRLLLKAYRLSGENNTLKTAISIELGEVYSRQSRYTDALQILADALTVTDSVKESQNYCGLLHTIGNIYGKINDHKTSLNYFKRVLSITKKIKNPMGQANALISIASEYNEIGKSHEAEKHAREALSLAIAGKNPMAESDILCILTDILLQQGKYKELEGFYDRMYHIAEITGNSFGRHLADMGVAHVAYNHKDYKKAITLLLQSLPELEAGGNWVETISGYKILYESYRQSGDYKNAFEAAVKYHNYTDAISDQDKVKELALLQSKLTFQKKELTYEKKQHVKNVIIIALCIIFFMAVLFAVVVFKNRQKLNRQKQLLLSAQLEKAEHSLRLSEVKLDDFTHRIREKSRLLEEMQQKMALHSDTVTELAAQLQQTTILTKEDWLSFKILFEQVHSGFLHKLKEKHPNITPAEVRYLALAKLQFSTWEMASSLGVSTQSIRTTWYRVRKKLDLPESLTVDELVADIA